MRQFALVFAAELRRRLRSRVYRLGTIIGMAGIGLIVALPLLLRQTLEEPAKSVTIAGPSFLTMPAFSLLSHDYTVVAVLPALPPALNAQWMRDHHTRTAIALSARNDRLRIELYAGDLSNVDHSIVRDLAPLAMALRTHVPLARVADTTHIDVVTRGVGTRFNNEVEATAAQGISFALMMFLYVATLTNGAAAAQSVVEEKTNRIAEVLVAAVRPAILLGAKIAALGIAGLIQLLLWLATGAAITSTATKAFGMSAGALAPHGDVIIAFVVFLVLGYLQYATLLAGASALVNRPEDVSAITIPFSIPLVCALFIAQYAWLSPSASIVIVTSMVPVLVSVRHVRAGGRLERARLANAALDSA